MQRVAGVSPTFTCTQNPWFVQVTTLEHVIFPYASRFALEEMTTVDSGKEEERHVAGGTDKDDKSDKID